MPFRPPVVVLLNVLVGIIVLLAPGRQAAKLQNITGLDGQWSSGSGNVTTGLEFFNPSDATFNIPKVSGLAYAFSEDGFFEESKYTYTSNGTSAEPFVAKVSEFGCSHGYHGVQRPNIVASKLR